MSTLHILSRSPFSDSQLGSCLRLLGPEDGLLLTGDAVYALLPGSPPLKALEQMPCGIALHALAEDLEARSIQNLPMGLQVLDYPAFVELCCHYDKVNSWQ